MTSGRSANLVRNVAVKTAAEGSGRVFNFLLALLGARILGPAAWGVYWSGFSLAHILTRATDLGGHLTLAREVARSPSRASSHLATSIRYKVALAVVIMAGWWLSGGAQVIPDAVEGMLAVALLCLAFTEWLGHYLRGFGHVVEESLLLAVDCLLAFACGAAALAGGAGIAGLAGSQVVAHALALAVAVGWVNSRVGLRVGFGNRRRLAAFARQAAPTGVAIFCSLASWRLGTLGLLWLAGPDSEAVVGRYSAAHRVLEGARFFPMAAAAALFPAFARLRAQAHPFQALMVLLPLTVLAGGIGQIPAVSAGALSVMFGPPYVSAAPMLRIMLLAYPLLTANALLTHWLIARGGERVNALLAVTHLAVHAAALAALVPAHGGKGAALALAAAEGVLFAGTLAAVRRLKS